MIECDRGLVVFENAIANSARLCQPVGLDKMIFSVKAIAPIFGLRIILEGDRSFDFAFALDVDSLIAQIVYVVQG